MEGRPMESFWVQGVVKNGQVVLETPLDLPDGTVVTVMDYDPADDPRPTGPTLAMTDTEFAEFTEYFTHKKDPKDLPAFIERVERSRNEQPPPARSA
jgi:hypothetical protein